MANVQLTITALPAHVRTARLLATAVARRAGIAETALDEIRLAVGEACSRAVEAHRLHCPQQPIQLRLIDGGQATTTGVAGQETNGTAAPPPGDDSVVADDARHGPGRFEVVVTDSVPANENTADDTAGDPTTGSTYLEFDTPAGGLSGLPADVGLAVITGLADHVTIEPGPTGTIIRLSWPLRVGPSVAPERPEQEETPDRTAR